MPFDPLQGRRGLRYIPDPLGRFGFGRYVPERELPDPFGRLPAPPRPDPEIVDFRNPVEIHESVGMAGKNRRHDVAKIETLLGRAGVLDLAETDGATGYVGARTDEAVRRFQKDRGLRVDGLITPEGPTLKALVSLARPVERRRPVPPGTIEEFPRPAPPSNPRRDTIRRTVERLLYRQRLGDDPQPLSDPMTHFAEAAPDNAETGTADAGRDKASQQPAPTPTSPPAHDAERPTPRSPLPEVPAYRKDVFAGQEKVWEEFNRDAGKLPGITETEKKVLSDIFAAEGGMRKDLDSSAASGILQETLERAKQRGKVPGIKNVEKPEDLTPAQRAAVMRDYFDDALRTVGGGKALDTIGDAKAAGAFADTIYRHGRKAGTEIIQEAVNEVRKTKNQPSIAEDGKMGPETLGAYRDSLTDPKSREELRINLRKIRQLSSPSEVSRIEFFTLGWDR